MVRTNDNGRPIPPRDVEVDEGDHAIAIHQDGQTIFAYERPSAFRDEPQWIERDHFAHGEIPRVSLENALIVHEPSNGDLQVVWVVTDEIHADGGSPSSEQQTSNAVGSGAADQVGYDYVVECECGERITESNQKTAMGETVDHLVREHDLVDQLPSIPYVPGYQNALINDRSEHPDGRNMEAPYELSGGYYLSTKLDAEQKQKHLSDLASKCGLIVEFKGKW